MFAYEQKCQNKPLLKKSRIDTQNNNKPLNSERSFFLSIFAFAYFNVALFHFINDEHHLLQRTSVCWADCRWELFQLTLHLWAQCKDTLKWLHLLLQSNKTSCISSCDNSDLDAILNYQLSTAQNYRLRMGTDSQRGREKKRKKMSSSLHEI